MMGSLSTSFTYRSLTGIYIFSLVSISFCTVNYNITYLNKHAGLYYDHLGSVSLSGSVFTLLSHFNLSVIDQKYEQLLNLYSKSLILCSHKHTSGSYNHVTFYCQNSLEILHNRISKLKDKIEVVNHVTGHKVEAQINRFKRGLCEGGSYELHWLTGVPEASDAKFYEESIKLLINDNRNIQVLMKQQVGIISNTISNLNALKMTENKLNVNIELFNNFSKQTSSSLIEIRLQQIITEQVALLTQMTTSLEDYYDLLISSITLAKHNILHPQVITPLNLMNELSRIMLRAGQRLPIPLSYSTIYKYFKLSKLDVMYINQVIIFAIKIPLVDELHYNLYKILPLPISHNTSSFYSYIEPSFPYLLMSTTKVYYSQLQNLEKCSMVTAANYICHQIFTTRTSEKPVCETMLLASVIKKIPNSCKTHTIQAELEIWQPAKENKWIFIITKPLRLTLTCKNFPIEDVKIETTGMLQLNRGCKGYTSTSVLQTTNSYTFKYANEIPEVNIVQDDCCIHNNALQLQPLKLINMKLEEFQYVNHRLRQFDESLQNQLSRSFAIEGSSWFSVAFSIIGFIVGITTVYNLLRWCGFVQLAKNFLCCTREPKPSSESCCTKIFNTNFSGVPVGTY